MFARPSYTKGDHDFPDMIMATPLHPVAYLFLRGQEAIYPE